MGLVVAWNNPEKTGKEERYEIAACCETKGSRAWLPAESLSFYPDDMLGAVL